jgi:hypothetical protein
MTENVVLAPGDRLTGSVIPLLLKPSPVAWALMILSAKRPVLVMVSDTVLVEPLATLPKLIEVALARILSPTPKPRSEIAAKGFAALLASRILPNSRPIRFGVNLTTQRALCPAASVNGNAGRTRLKASLLDLASDTVRLPSPLFVNSQRNDALRPSSTCPAQPKEGLAASVPLTPKARD